MYERAYLLSLSICFARPSKQVRSITFFGRSDAMNGSIGKTEAPGLAAVQALCQLLNEYGASS